MQVQPLVAELKSHMQCGPEALNKRDPKELPSPLCYMRTQLEGAGYEPGRGLSPEHNLAGTLILGFQALEF